MGPLISGEIDRLVKYYCIPGGGFKYFYFHPYLGKIPILTSIFFRWVVQPPTSIPFGQVHGISIFLWEGGLGEGENDSGWGGGLKFLRLPYIFYRGSLLI